MSKFGEPWTYVDLGDDGHAQQYRVNQAFSSQLAVLQSDGCCPHALDAQRITNCVNTLADVPHPSKAKLHALLTLQHRVTSKLMIAAFKMRTAGDGEMANEMAALSESINDAMKGLFGHKWELSDFRAERSEDE